MTQTLLDLAVHAARVAGGALLQRYGHAGDVEVKSSATDPVSDADRASEALLVETILAARPDDGLLGEEGADARSESGLRWVIDPLDGTVNYLYRHPGWSVSVACEQRDGASWITLVGVVHDPLAGETYRASRGAGAWLGDRRLRVNDPVPIDQALVATGFAYDSRVRRRQGAMVAALLPRVRDIRRVGSAALDLCAVAAGRVDAYYEDSSSRWDWLAGALIASEAGAVVTPLSAPEGSTGVLAAGPALHPALAALLV
ncbi:MAG: inositol monophosphatase family protein [Egibacteraceae bacterium]